MALHTFALFYVAFVVISMAAIRLSPVADKAGQGLGTGIVASFFFPALIITSLGALVARRRLAAAPTRTVVSYGLVTAGLTIGLAVATIWGAGRLWDGYAHRASERVVFFVAPFAPPVIAIVIARAVAVKSGIPRS